MTRCIDERRLLHESGNSSCSLCLVAARFALIAISVGHGQAQGHVLTSMAATPIASILATVHGESGSNATNGGDTAAPIPRVLEEIAQADLRAGPRDRVLNEMRAGITAFELGEYNYALPLFMDAHDQIETIYADDATAKKARSVFTPDATKEFKGDAYERAMLGYYLGLSYMMKGDMENARASFKWGEFQDTMSFSETYQSDMGALLFLKAWVARCQGDTNTAAEEFSAAKRIRDTIAMPAEQDRLLTIVEVGSSPIKLGIGKYKENLSFQRGVPSSSKQVTVSFGEQVVSPVLAEDIYWQASTLGGRAVDKILAGKASFKQGAETTANVAGGVAQVGLAVANQAALTGDYNTANTAVGASAIALIFSIGAKVVSDKAKPAADVRYWSNLPDRILLTTSIYPNQDVGTVRYKSADGVELQADTVPVRTTGSCYLAWDREGPSSNRGSSTYTSIDSPPPATVQEPVRTPSRSERKARRDEEKKEEKDKSDVITVF